MFSLLTSEVSQKLLPEVKNTFSSRVNSSMSLLFVESLETFEVILETFSKREVVAIGDMVVGSKRADRPRFLYSSCYARTCPYLSIKQLNCRTQRADGGPPRDSRPCPCACLPLPSTRRTIPSAGWSIRPIPSHSSSLHPACPLHTP